MWRMWLLFKSKEQCDTSQTNPYRKGSSSGLPWLWTVLTSDRPGVELSSVMTSASNQAQKRFKCDECDYETNYKCNLKQHELNHTGEKPFECNFCEKKFSQSQTLENHRNEISYFQRIWNWQQWFWWQNLSPTSVANIGAGVTSLVISDQPIFDFLFGLWEITKRQIHIGGKTFNCDQCDFTTTNKTRLTAHLRGHNGEKPYKDLI